MRIYELNYTDSVSGPVASFCDYYDESLVCLMRPMP
jgi:hypothetical protein